MTDFLIFLTKILIPKQANGKQAFENCEFYYDILGSRMMNTKDDFPRELKKFSAALPE